MRVVRFRTHDGLRMKAVEFCPRSRKKVPAVLIVEGSGKSPDARLAPDSPFFRIGKALASAGYYVLTFNKRGSGLNTSIGSFYRSDFRTDNRDAQAALDFTLAHKQVDGENIFLLGQSMGGVHITFLAQKNKIAGNIYFAAPFSKFRDLMLRQTRTVLSLQGRRRKDIAAELHKLASVLGEIDKGHFAPSRYPEICKKIEGANIIDGVQQKYLRYVLKIDAARELARLKVPVLILQGTSDFVVGKKDIRAALAALKLAGKKDAILRILPAVDHIFASNRGRLESLKYMIRVQRTRKYKPLARRILPEIRSFLNTTLKAGR